ncbi:MAG: CRISPR-associated endoribonuclease Cas6 [Deltaproteobacteria bacterium]|nr:MAG: CRISPR-associated endoribonuclease Cas6 [Deltaproteobacteria bacterium]
MRITLTFNANSPIKFPIQYNHLLQAFIYRHLSSELSDFLHQEGFLYGKRRFKLFTFSNLMGKYRIHKKEGVIEFFPPFKLVVSSPVERFIQELAEILIRRSEVDLIGQKVLIEGIEVHFTPSIDGDLLIKMLSPMTMSSTLRTPDGRSKRYYYSPFEREFSTLMERNIQKKYELIHNSPADGLHLEVIPERVDKSCEKILNFKGTVVKAWRGTYRLRGSPELLHTAYECGLGVKNSQGFGCFEVVKRKEGH